MAKTKFFTELVTGDSAGGASAEDMERGYSEADVGAMPDDGAWLMTSVPEEGGGFLGRPMGWER